MCFDLSIRADTWVRPYGGKGLPVLAALCRLFRFQLFVVVRLLHLELFVQVVIAQRQMEHGHGFLQQGGLGGDIGRILGFHVDKLPAFGVHAKGGELVGHVIVQQVEDEERVLVCQFLLHLVVHRAQCLCACLAGFGGEGVAQHGFAHLGIAAVHQRGVEFAAAGLVVRFDEFQIAVRRAEVDIRPSLAGGGIHGGAHGLGVGGVVGVFAYGHAEQFGELRPVVHGAALVEHIRGGACQDAQRFLSAYHQQVAVGVERLAGDVVLAVLDEPPHRVHMLARHAVVIYPALFVEVELQQGKSPELCVQRILDEAQEPRTGYLLVHPVVWHAVPAELYLAAQHTGLPFLRHAEQVGVQQCVVIEVVQADAAGEVHILRSAQGGLVGVHVKGKTARGGQGDGSAGAEVAALGDAPSLFVGSGGAVVAQQGDFIDQFHTSWG